MDNLTIPLATSSWDDAEYNAIQRVVDSGFFSMGKEVEAFEKNFSEYLSTNHCVMVNSGSSANLLMVASLFYCKNDPLKPGDEVIVPAVSWSTTYFPLHQYGLKLKFVDIDRDTLNYDLAKLNNAVSDETRLIMVVNLLGNPNDFEAIKKIIGARSIKVIEDNCESMGAEFKGKKAGTFGLMGSFSSFFSHHISTMEGGIVCTDDEELYHIMLSLRAHGWTRNLPKKNKVCKKQENDTFGEAFRFVLPGYNLRPLEMSGAIGLSQLEKLPTLISERRKNGALFQQYFGGNEKILIQKEIGKSSWFGFSLVLREGTTSTRTKLINILQSNGVEVRPIVTGNFANKDVIKYMEVEMCDDLSAAEHIDKHGLFIGNHHFPLERQFENLHSLLRDL